MSAGTLRARMLADVARSGLDARDAKKLALREVAAPDMVQLTGFDVDGYELPNFDPVGRKRASRYRALPRNSADYKGPKYMQPEGQPNLLYFPPILKNLRWSDVVGDPNISLAVTEGEKKSAIACKHSFATIAIPGVWSFLFSTTSKKDRANDFARSLRVIKDFDLVAWRDRHVFLIFDSDVTEKLGVELALNGLAGELLKRGALPVQLLLPSKDDEQSRT